MSYETFTEDTVIHRQNSVARGYSTGTCTRKLDYGDEMQGILYDGRIGDSKKGRPRQGNPARRSFSGKYLRDAIGAGVAVTACGPSKEMLYQMGIREDNLEPAVEFEDVIGFLNAALPAAKKGGMVVFI